MINLNTRQHQLQSSIFSSFLLFHLFLLVVFFLIISIQTLMHQEAWMQSISHIVYFESFCYVMYYIVLEICIGGYFLEDCFYYYSQQIKSAVANESLIPYNLRKRVPYFLCVENCYILTWNLAHILINLKTFKEATKAFWM